MTTTKKPAPKKKPAAKPTPQAKAQPIATGDGSEWNVLYTPLWRAVLALGVVVGLDAAKAHAREQITNAVRSSWEWRQSHAADSLPVVTLHWVAVSDTQWEASGNDGILETTLPIVTLTRIG